MIALSRAASRPFLGLALAAAAALSACVPVVLGGAAASGGYVAGQERGAGGLLKDEEIRAKIDDSWYKYNSDMAGQLNLSVYDQRVLITGIVANPEWKREAALLARQTDGVKQVNDEVVVKSASSIGDLARDKAITYRLRSAILLDSDIRSVNYTIDTVDGVVYLSGSARTQAELDKVIDYARNIPNVRRVVNYVEIRPGEPQPAAASGAAAPPPAAPSTGAGAGAGGDAATPSPAPAPAAPIEVTPLK